MLDRLPEELLRILRETPELERAYLAGGCVRDWLLDIPGKDIDIEVYGVTFERLAESLRCWGRTDLVGRSFGVIKLTTPSKTTYDFAIPRRDSKTAAGHKGFEVDFDPSIEPKEAAARRDFTLNALMYDPRRNEILDFFGGQDDLDHRLLRHTSNAFPEDPLRVLRGMQFAARFEMTAAPETLELCRSIKDSFPELAKDRVRDEWFKWAAKCKRPSLGLFFLRDCGWIEHFPEIAAMIGTPQDPEWHPEGDVFTHTCHCCDALARLPEWQSADESTRLVQMLAVLTHDFGKPATTQTVERKGRKRIASPGHEAEGCPIAQRFFDRIQAPGAIRERVLPLIANHMFRQAHPSDRAVRRLAERMKPESIENLCVVMTADAMGRPPKPPEAPEFVDRLREKAQSLSISDKAPSPVLMGRHLIDRGYRPGKPMGVLLEAAFEAQLDGEFEDLEGALEWLSQREAAQGDTEVGQP